MREIPRRQEFIPAGQDLKICVKFLRKLVIPATSNEQKRSSYPFQMSTSIRPSLAAQRTSSMAL